MQKTNRAPKPGEVYIAKLPNGYWSALVVLHKIERSYLVYAAAYYELIPPALEDVCLTEFYYEKDLYSEGLKPSIYWLDGKPSGDFLLLGSIDLEEKSEIKESNIYAGIWKNYLPSHIMWEKEREAGVFQEKIQSFEQANSEAVVVELEDDVFWNLIDLIDWKKRHPMNPLISRLKKGTEEMIFAFEETLGHKLFLLDAPAHAGITDQPDTYLSVDAFLYARCAVVAKGKDCFNQTVKNAAAINMEWDAEELLEVASEAYSKKTGEPFDYASSYDYETYSNRLAWESK
ncbi:DUF4240 domain-containing protein [Planococcus ruber]|uniref:DUF4240 domain-containing protein n=1 Tax=Planococcus ruber TaxID=2027871 RepID=UPI001FEFC936|nr:DUF4240 domain-containing protein [Planococcus ruber]MCJ1908993.1 DUF4240 domain-containing protein [Planococcus ruber]